MPISMLPIFPRSSGGREPLVRENVEVGSQFNSIHFECPARAVCRDETPQPRYRRGGFPANQSPLTVVLSGGEAAILYSDCFKVIVPRDDNPELHEAF